MLWPKPALGVERNWQVAQAIEDNSHLIMRSDELLRIMKAIVIVLSGLVLVGCSGLGQGEKAWFSALELENLARDYVKTNKIDFDFTDSETTIWVSTGGGRILAEVFFSPPRYGRPALNVEIGRNGKVLGHRIAAMLCGSFLR